MPKLPDILRCPECRTRRKDRRLMTLHRLDCKRPLCHCLAGATYPHRPGGTRTCDHHPLAGMFRALLAGATPEQAEEIAIDIALRGGLPRSKACPF